MEREVIFLLKHYACYFMVSFKNGIQLQIFKDRFHRKTLQLLFIFSIFHHILFSGKPKNQ